MWSPLDRIATARETSGNGQVEVTTTTSRVYRFHPETPDLAHKLVTAVSDRKPGTGGHKLSDPRLALPPPTRLGAIGWTSALQAVVRANLALGNDGGRLVLVC